MRKIGFLAVAAAVLAVSISMPAQSADKPVYSMWSPTYRGMTRHDLEVPAINFQEMEDEARSRQLNYALVGLVGLFGAIAVFAAVRKRRYRIAATADSALVGTLAAVISSKRRLGSRIEARIDSKAKPSTED
ncbi:hypothetical protein NKH24_06935 [Mesorhizobium sp. M1300]|uniref:hypothetical protein n=1 Tax=Mesorhizobium sp. M1300 TaxID=2957077 RepID=UPI0033355233